MISQAISVDSIDSNREELVEEVTDLRLENRQLKERVAWFEKQLFGSKSEKRHVAPPEQTSLLGSPTTTPPDESDQQTITYQRGKAKKRRPEDCATDAGLRFTDEVPIEVIKVIPPELEGEQADQYEVIDTQVRHKLAQRPASYVVLQYEIPILKRRVPKEEPSTQAAPTSPTTPAPQLITPIMPDQVFENSIADVSVLSGLLVDKFCYHLPLYRQHQRLSQSGVTVARSTLTNWCQRSIELLRPIVEAQLRHVLQSKVLAMDETPIKAGRQHKGKMKQGYFWPVYGEADEIVFTYSDSRGRRQIEALLGQSFEGTILTDGYAAYARYVKQTEPVTHAQCWIHCRRHLIDARARDPVVVDQALDLIGQLYQVESQIRDQELENEKKRDYRLTHSKPLVDQFFQWCEEQIHRPDLTPSDSLMKAIRYAMNREAELRVFLENPDVQPDTNHLERSIRPIPMGRKNWLFCWTELGAEHVGLIQSLISTCKLHRINPYTYLTDVLQRISQHPASRIKELTPGVWKTRFAENPMRSPLQT